MEFAKVTAIIRRTVVENVEMALEKAGVSGFTGVFRIRSKALAKSGEV